MAPSSKKPPPAPPAAPLLDAYDWSSFERVVVLSPHLDDAALSCGSLLGALRGRVSRLVITICCGEPTPRRALRGPARACDRRGFAPPSERRREDIAAMRSIRCDVVHLGFADAIYRRSPTTGELLYRRAGAHLSSTSVDDGGHVEELYVVLRRLVADLGRLILISPLGIGHHVDHILCAQTALRLAGAQRPLLFYEDFPYVVREERAGAGSDDARSALARLGRAPGKCFVVPVDVEDKLKLILHYRSQVPVILGGEEELRRGLEESGAERYWTTRARGRSES